MPLVYIISQGVMPGATDTGCSQGSLLCCSPVRWSNWTQQLQPVLRLLLAPAARPGEDGSGTCCVPRAAGPRCKQLAWWYDCCGQPPTSLLQALDKRDKDLRDKLSSVKDNSTELNSLQEQAEKVTVLWLPLPALGCRPCACSPWRVSESSRQPGVHPVALPPVPLKKERLPLGWGLGWGMHTAAALC